MANNYYNFPVAFVPGTKVRSEQVNTQYQGLESAFDLLPTDPVASIIGTAWLAVDVQGATVNEYLLTNPDPQSALTNGQRVSFFATHTNTGAVTFNVDGLGVVNAVDNDGAVLGANDIILGQYYEFIYDNANTQFTRSLAAGSTSTFPQITATSSNVIDLVDVDVALRVGAVDPLTAAHLEFDPTTIQAKGDATNVNQLQLNPLGGEVAIGNQSGPATGEGILLYQDGFEMANIDRSAWAFSAADVWDPAVPDPYEFLFEFYDRDANNFWGSIGWDPATTDMRFQQFGDGGGFIFSGALDSGVPFELMTMDPEEGINFLPDGNSPLFVEPAGVSTVSGAVYLDNGATLYMAEITAAQVDIGGYGQLWVNDAFTPNRLFFTGDTGVDVDLTTVGGSPGGADTQVQFNNSGVFGGSANLTWDDTNLALTNSSAQSLRFQDTGRPANEQNWEINLNGIEFKIRSANDAYNSFDNILVAERDSGTTLGSLVLGNTNLNVFTLNAAATGTVNVNAQVVNLGNYQFDADQTVGAGQDNFVLTYDNGTGQVSLEAAASGFTFDGSATTGDQIAAVANALLTSGTLLDLSSNLSTFTGSVLSVVNDHASSSGVALDVRNDGTGDALVVTGSQTITQALGIDALTVIGGHQGVRAGYFYSNEASRTFPVVDITNDNATGFGIGLRINNDQAGVALQVIANNGTGATFNQSGASDAVEILPTNAGARGLYVYTNTATRTVPLVNLVNDNSTGTSDTLDIQHDQAGGRGINVEVTDPAARAMRLYTNEVATAPLLEIINDNAVTAYAGLEIRQDGKFDIASINLVGGYGGIKFDYTNDNTDPNTLDAYEEGTFEVTMTAQTSGTITMQGAANLLGYVRIGRLVAIFGKIEIASVSSPVGIIKVNGLPFAPVTTEPDDAELIRAVFNAVDLSSANTGVLTAQTNGTSLDLRQGDGTTISNIDTLVQSNTQLIFNFHYITDANP